MPPGVGGQVAGGGESPGLAAAPPGELALLCFFLCQDSVPARCCRSGKVYERKIRRFYFGVSPPALPSSVLS